MEKARRFLAVLLTICMVFSTQSVTLLANEIQQEETQISDEGTVDEALAENAGTLEADALAEDILEEDIQEEQLLGAGQVALTDVTATITATAPSSDITNMDRGGSFALNVAYTVKDEELPRAKENLTWTYDLSQLVTTSPISDVSGSGNLYDGSTRAGTFSVIDNIVYLYIDEDYIEPKEEGVQGTFQLNLSLDAAEVGTADSITLNFPGGSTVEPTFPAPTMNSSKTVNNQPITDGKTISMTPNDDGTYTLNYNVTMNPNCTLTQLTLTDTISGKQQFVPDSLAIQYNYGGITPVAQTINGNSFTLDLISAMGHNAENGKQIVVTYSTVIAEEDLGNEETNDAVLNWNGNTTECNTDITTARKVSITKDIVDNGDETYTYTIVIGDEKDNLAGFTVLDRMTDTQIPEGPVHMVPHVPGVHIEGSPVFKDDSYSTNSEDFFSFTFPEEGNFSGPYTITYKVKHQPTVKDSVNLYNRATVSKGDLSESDDASIVYTPALADDVTMTKSFGEWNPDDKTATWSATVNIADGAQLPLTNVILHEVDYNYDIDQNNYNQWSDGVGAAAMELDLSGISIETLSGGQPVAYTVDGSDIKIDSLSENIVINGIKTSIPVDFTNDLWASNTIKFEADGQKDKSATDTKRYNDGTVEPEPGFVNKDGTFDKETKELTWTVTINPKKQVLDPNQTLIFGDEFSEGQELVDGKINVAIEGYYSGNKDVNVSTSGCKIDPTLLTGPEVGESIWGNQYYYPFGISGNKITITYKTRLTEEGLEAFNAVAEYPVSNTAYMCDENGQPIGGGESGSGDDSSATKTVVLEHDYVVKNDITPDNLTDDTISYSIDVNPEALKLNNGNPLTLTDKIATTVDLVLNSVKVTGTDDAIVSYNDDTRILTVQVPDETACVVAFDVRSEDLGDITFGNECNLAADEDSWSDATSEKHQVKKHAGTVTGTANTIYLSKIDEYAITTKLQGAEFDLFDLQTDSEGKIIGGMDDPIGHYTSNRNGAVTLPHLTPYKLYGWKETKAPDGYVTGSEGMHYFVMYSIAMKDGAVDEVQTALNKERAKDIDHNIQEANEGVIVNAIKDTSTWTVTNIKKEVEETTSVSATKVWNDSDNEAEARTDVTLHLMKQVGSAEPVPVEGEDKTIAADATGEDLSVEWTELPVSEEGEDIIYTVTEDPIEGYATKITGDAENGFTVTNTYAVEKYVPAVTKVLVGEDAPAETYYFELTDNSEDKTGEKFEENGMTASVSGEGTAEFGEITYTKAGIYTYTISETAGNTSGMDYSEAQVIITVTVDADADGALTITKIDTDGGDNENHELVNEYTKPEASATLCVTKAVNGLYDGDETFEFKLAKVDETTSDVIANDTAEAAKGATATFEAIKYTEEGDYYYSITEQSGDTTGMFYDTAAKYAYVHVEMKDDELQATTIRYGDSIEEAEGNLLDRLIEFFTGGQESLTVTNTFSVVKISKTDLATSGELKGAVLTVTQKKDAGGADVNPDDAYTTTWTSDGEAAHEIYGLKDGTYELTEDQAPLGYGTAEKITFVIKDGMVTGTDDNKIVMSDTQNKTDIKISKTDVTNGGVELADAELTVTMIKNAAGEDVDAGEAFTESWTSGTTPHEIKDLADGTYTLTEVSAPEGYKQAEMITFVIKDGKLEEDGNCADGVVTMQDEQYKGGVSISKQDLDQGTELKGASLTVTKKGETEPIDSWVSEGTQHEISDLADGTYVLTETSAPAGYAVSTENIEFTIKNGKLVDGEYAADGVVTMKDKQYKTDVQISKVILGQGQELAGADLTLTRVANAAGEAVSESVTSWKSDGDIHLVEGLTDGKYTLTEESAPDGYKKAESITFEIKNGALVTEGNSAIEEGVVVMADALNKTNVKISKVDAADGVTELKDAKLTVVRTKDASGNDVSEEGISWISDGTTHTVEGLLDGTYTLTEESAPNGYKVAEKITFVIKDGALVTEGNAAIEDGVVKMADELYKTDVQISKVDAGAGTELAGAMLTVARIADASGNTVSQIVESWLSSGNVHTVAGLTDGTYTLTEESAPGGYQKAETIEFVIKDGKLVEEGNDAIKDGVVKMADKQYKGGVTISKVALGQGKELVGADLVVTQTADASGAAVSKEIASWKSDGTQKELTDLADGTYVLTETSAPEGYEVAESIEFTIQNGNLVNSGDNVKDGVVTMTDEFKKTDVQVSKVDAGAGSELKGATLTVTRILDIDGNEVNAEVDSWESDGNIHTVAGLTDGTYTLKEESAPNGYKVAESITFVIKNGALVTEGNGAIEGGVVKMADELFKTDVQISKVDAGAGTELPGATLTVARIADASGSTVSQIVETWVSDGNIHTVAGLTDGTYTLTEESAPGGYQKAETIEFVIKDGKLVEEGNDAIEDGVVKMADKQYKGGVTISKVALGQGKELVGADLVVTQTADASGAAVSKEIASWKSDGTQKELTDLEDGTYVLTETSAPEGYEVAESIEFTIQGGNLVNSGDNVKDGVVTMSDDFKKTDVQISKVDAGAGSELKGATLTVTRIVDIDGNEVNAEVDSWESDGDIHTVAGLTDGTYTLKEESAPNGYKVAESITFVIKNGALVTEGNEAIEDGIVKMADKQFKTDVKISKVDAGQGNELIGAELTVTRIANASGEEKNQIIESWTSNGSAHEVAGLTDGTYTLTEKSAPKGFEIAESITFVIKNGELVEDENAKNGIVTMKDEQKKTDVQISKVDAGAGNELAGATLTLTKEGQEEAIDSWLSDGSIHTVTGLTDGIYTLVEESAPDGYKKAESITFTIEDGKLVEEGNDAIVDGVVKMADEQYKGGVSISKEVLGQGKELAGAELKVTKIKDATGAEVSKVVDSWTTNGSQHEIADLEDGTYVLTETSAPEGYEIAESIEFTIQGGNLVNSGDNVKDGVVTMSDALKKTDVKISKVDAGAGNELVGAELTVTRIADIDGNVVSDVIESWTSDGTTHEVAGLTDGTYTLTEESAPNGYKVAESITFVIKNGALVTEGNDAIEDGVVKMADKQFETNVKISKVDAGQGNELIGAELTVTRIANASGEEVNQIIESWTSNGSAHEVAGLTDGTYTLTEKSAPKGYEVAESVTFVIKNGELVEDANAKDGIVTMKDEQKKTDVQISKVAAGAGNELAGATLTLTKEGQEGAVDIWTSDGNIHTVADLTDGVYTLVEESAPNGYKKAESITFTIEDGKLVENANVKDGIVTMKDELYSGGVSISKEVLGQGKELAGAELTVTKIKDAAGAEVSEIIESWTTDGSQHEIANLEDGTYVLTETSAPEGYVVAESIEFTIKDGKLVEDENAQGGVVTMQDALKKTDVKISKVDAGQGNELIGATLTVTRVADIDGNEVSDVIENWTSDGSVHEVTGLTDGTYTLTEESAPKGYKVAESITFTIKDGKLVEDENAKDGIVTMKDEQKKTDVQISKVDAGAGNELKGATLTLTKEGQEEAVDSWTSDGTVHTVAGLTDGVYTLVEESAPNGYKKAESITFTIKDGKLVEEGNDAIVDGVVKMADEQYSGGVSISKEVLGQGKELAGAELTVTKIKDAAGSEVSEIIESWTTDGSQHEIANLEDGTYVLKEMSAPEGYVVAESIEFTIKDGKLVEDENAQGGVVTMQDALKKTDVKISKVDAGQGNELIGATLTVTRVADIDGNEVNDVIESWTSDGSVHEVAGLTDGTYTLAEESAPNGYKVAESITFTIKDGKLVEDENAKDGIVTMKDEQKKTDVQISKVAAGAGNELAGATLTLTKEGQDDAVDSWISDGSIHTVAGLTDGVYTLVEESAPDGYKKAESITFTIKDGKLVEEGNDAIVDGVVRMADEQYKGGVSISKEVLGQGKELAGAVLEVKQIADAEGTAVSKEIASWKTDGTQKELTDLEDGTYVLTEKSAPEGYEVAESIEFTIKDGKLVDDENAQGGVVTMQDALKKTDVKVSKVAAGAGNELIGATLTVTRVADIDGNEVSDVIESWTSDGSVHEVAGLTDGTYTLTEESAPEGYKVAESITFVIKDGKLVEDENAKDGIVTMKDEQKKTDVQISKVDAGQGNELVGAALILTKEGQDETVDKWKSDGSIHVVAGLTDGTYTLTELSAPDGYQKAESITFVIKDGKLVEDENVINGVVTMQDKQYAGGVSVSKQALGQGTELAGASLTVTKKGETEAIESWTSDGTLHEIADLEDGTYVLTETSAPEGYEVAESIEFTLKDGKLVESSYAKDGVVTMKDALKTTDVKISKVDAGAGAELKGATLTVTRIADINGNEANDLIESWTSNGTAHEVAGLTDGTYRLVEESAPNGYKVAESITFTIKDGKLVEDANAKDGIVTMKDELFKTDVKVSKVDAGAGNELIGAKLTVEQITDAEGTEVSETVESWTSDGTVHEVNGLTDGTYTLTESSAPAGYEIAETIIFVIKNGKLVEDENAKNGIVTMKDGQKKTDVKISKIDAGAGNELAGATLTLTKEGQDEAVDSWISDGSIHVVTGITDGVYTLIEESAPDGYKKAESITFTVKDGMLVSAGNDAIVDGVVVMADEQYSGGVSISKEVLGQGNELAGADLTVTKIADASGNEVSELIDSWTTDGKQHEIADLADGKYVLTETSAPEGYEVAESIEFTIKDGKLVDGENASSGVVTMQDAMKKTDVKISKTDAGQGGELIGAMLMVTRVMDIAGDEVNDLIESWTSDGTVHEITGLTDGTYTLVEESAPNGYKVAESITFTIKDGKLVEDENVKDGVVTMKDEQKKTDVQISKVDAGAGNELAGATLTVTRIADAAGTEVSEAVDSWISDGSIHTVAGLTDGTYTLTEESAPNGYKVAESITFVIKDGKLVEEGNDAIVDGVVKMADAQYKTDVQISKVDIGAGTELAGAELTVTRSADASGKEVDEVVESWTSDGNIHTVAGLTDGTYILTEESAPDGYKKAESIAFTIKDGKLVEEGNDAIVDGIVKMADEQYKGGVSISKVALGQGTELAGADLTVTKVADASGNEVSELVVSWTTDGTQHEIADLADGKYILTETSAPEGYEVAENIEFTIKDGKLVEDANAKDGVVTMADALKKTDVKISKVDAGAGTELVGAELTVTRIVNIAGEEVSEVIESWTSEGSVHEIVGLTDGTYTLVEASAPYGYKVAESITFVIKDGKLAEDENAADGVVTMKDELYRTDVKISKVDAGQGNELAGATLTITKEGQDEAVESWISDGTVHTVAGLTDGTYTLVEESAPDGYKKAESITFTIKNGALVAEGNDAVVDGVVKMADEQYKGGVSISKEVLGQGNELAGADLTVTKIADASGNEVNELVDSWKTDGKQHEIADLTDGTYVLTETSAPEGYEVAESIVFAIIEGKLFEGENAQGGVVTMQDAMKKTDVKISKTDAGQGNELAGASLTVTRVADIAGNEVNDVIESWTSDGTVHEIAGLTDGTYTLVEESAPNGYKVAESITFTIKGGKLAEDENVKDGVVTMKDEQFKTDVKVSKVDAGQGNELTGANLTVTKIADAAGAEVSETVESWTSDGKVHEIAGLTDGTYTLTEESAPEGYNVAESITFVIKDGKLVEGADVKDGVVTMKDEQKKTDVQISKVDAGQGNELAGATLTITKEGQDEAVDSWISNGTVHTVAGLTDGTYTLVEESAPEGYKKAESITFTIKDGKLVEDENAKNGVVTMKDELYKGGVSISKQVFGQGNELEGAELTVRKIADASGKEVDKKVDSWTSDGTQHEIADLEDGRYVLTETSAPEGYEVAESIEFTIKNGKLVEGENAEDGVVTMLDALKKTDVKISKVDAGAGNELQGAELTVTRIANIAGQEVNEVVESWTSDGSVHTVAGLTDGTYTLTEETAPDGYKKAESITFVIKDGKLVEDANAKDGIVTMKDERIKVNVKIILFDKRTGKKVKGVRMIVRKSDNEVVDEWETEDKEHEIKELILGETYTLEEEVPAGYEAVDSLKFRVDKDGNILRLNEDGSTSPLGEDGIFPVNITPSEINFKVNKVDAGTGEEVEGADLAVVESGQDGKETVLERWTSKKGETHDFGSKLEHGKKYLLREVTAPEGYGKLTTDIAFSVNEDGTIQTELATTKDADGNIVYLVENTKISVKISKVDIASGAELEGAKIRILDKDGQVIDEWTSTKAVHVVTGLKPGETYTLSETVAPTGYAITTDTKFVLKEDGSIDTTKTTTAVKDGVLLVQDKMISVKVRKQDTDGNLLGGAKLKISYRNNKEVKGANWTTEAGKEHTITGLTAGSYYLYEVQPPAGYLQAAKIAFEIDAYGRIIRDGKVVSAIVMTDQKRPDGNSENKTTITQRPASSTSVSTKSTTGSTTTAKAKTTGAKTGDNSPIMLYIILLVAAGAVIVVIRRRSQSNK